MKRRHKKSKAKSGRERIAPAANPVSSPPSPALTPQRRWLFRLFALVFLPAFAFGALELGLRLTGCGYPTGFFERVRAGGQEFLANNEKFSLRFFPPQLARWPGPIMLAAHKPADTCRIFVLGESAARGEPEPPYSAGRYLEAMLRERFPGENFEVVNVAITAINSHVILPIARDCARQQGDIWIIYMGNNEMVGPFGAATVFGAQAPPLWSVRLSLAIQQTRVGQFVMSLTRKLKGKTANASWGGMKMFLGNQLRPDDPRKEVVYRNFQNNLRDILRTGLDSGAKIILNTMAVNLADCPPFASMPATNLPAADRSAANKFFADAARLAEQGQFQAAALGFEQVGKLDFQNAETQFRLGECLLHLTNFAAAHEHFQLACDRDALPFRTDSRINGIIRKTGQDLAGPGLEVFESAAALETNSASGICGAESFYEHVHFNFDGNYHLARCWADEVEKFLPVTIKSRATAAWAGQDECERILGLTDWNRGAVIETVIGRLQRPPLSGQFNNARRTAALKDQLRQLSLRTDSVAQARARQICLAAIRRAPADHWLHENFADFLESIGDVPEAASQWQQVCELLPYNCNAFQRAGRLLEHQGKLPAAQAALLRAVALRPSMTEGWFELGNVHYAEGQFETALLDYERAQRLEPQDASYTAFVGKALSKLNRRAGAIEHYRQALQLQPDLWEAHFALGDELAADKKITDARIEYQEVLKLQPTNMLAHLDVAVMLAQEGHFDEALREFDETLRLDPGNRQAQEYRDRVQGWKNHQR